MPAGRESENRQGCFTGSRKTELALEREETMKEPCSFFCPSMGAVALSSEAGDVGSTSQRLRDSFFVTSAGAPGRESSFGILVGLCRLMHRSRFVSSGQAFINDAMRRRSGFRNASVFVACWGRIQSVVRQPARHLTTQAQRPGSRRVRCRAWLSRVFICQSNRSE